MHALGSMRWNATLHQRPALGSRPSWLPRDRMRHRAQRSSSTGSWRWQRACRSDRPQRACEVASPPNIHQPRLKHVGEQKEVDGDWNHGTLRRTGPDATHSLPSHGPRAGGGEQNTRRLNSPTNSLDSGWRKHSVTRPSAPTNGASVEDVEEEEHEWARARPPPFPLSQRDRNNEE